MYFYISEVCTLSELIFTPSSKPGSVMICASTTIIIVIPAFAMDAIIIERMQPLVPLSSFNTRCSTLAATSLLLFVDIGSRGKYFWACCTLSIPYMAPLVPEAGGEPPQFTPSQLFPTFSVGDGHFTSVPYERVPMNTLTNRQDTNQAAQMSTLILSIQIL